MDTLDQAQARLIEALPRIAGQERATLVTAVGRVLAQDVTAPVDVPPADVSLFDGYALCAPLDEGACLQVTGEQFAGDAPTRLAPGHAMRIFTGAVLPEGANAVIAQESTRQERDGDIVLFESMRAGAGVRCRAADSRAGTVVLRAGTTLTPAHVGLLGSIGCAEVVVVRRVRVALFTTGDELVEPGQTLSPGKIFNANHALLHTALSGLGAEVVDLGCLPDDETTLRCALADAAEQVDLVLTSGGVSVGEADLVRKVVDELGGIAHWRVFLKPGKPLAYGWIGNTPFIGLPGNPVSTFVTFYLFVRPSLRALQGGAPQIAAPMLTVPAGFALQGGDRPEFMRVRCENVAGQTRLARYPDQNSGLLGSLAWADGVALIAPGARVEPGDPLPYIPFGAWFS